MDNETQVQVSDLLKAYRDQREGALDVVASLNAQVAQMKRVIEYQGQQMIEKDAQIALFKSLAVPANGPDGEVAKDMLHERDIQADTMHAVAEVATKKGVH